MKVLLAADDSPCALRAVAHVVNNIGDFGAQPEIHLVHVQYQLPGRMTGTLPRETVQSYYEEESAKALEPARAELKRAGIAFKEIHLIGQYPGITVADYATREKFSLVVMGSHGRGPLTGLVLGSVARHVLGHCTTPALIIR